MTANKIRVGIIGCGSMGRHHCRVYSEMDDVEIVGVCDINKMQATQLANKYRTIAYFDHLKLLNQKLDAVNVVVPTSLHAAITLDALKGGINVLVEKPIANTVYWAQLMVKAAQEACKILMVGHVERFNPVVQMAKRLIDNGQIGEILSIHTERIGPYPKQISDVGVMLDLAIHDIDIISYLSGQQLLQTQSDRHISSTGIEDEAILIFRVGDIMASVHASWRSLKKIRSMMICGEDGVISLDYIHQDLELFKGQNTSDVNSFAHLLLDFSTGTVHRPMITKREPLHQELLYFIKCVRNETKPCISGEEAIKVLQSVMDVTSHKNKEVQQPDTQH